MRIIIIAGPNGAGKTTFARDFLPCEANCPEFINADNIAAGLSPFQPDLVAWQAGRIMLDRLKQLSAQGIDFAFETTLSTRSYINRIRQWQAAGYCVELHFLKLPDADWAVRRVAERVRLGGHNIPESTIRRRYLRGWQNFENDYKAVVDAWKVYDNATMPPRELESGPPKDMGIVEESQPTYGSKSEKETSPERQIQPISGGLAALTRAAEKAIARARAAGLEPVVRYEKSDDAS